ncbi:hypothetical protein DDZ15_02160 [Rhodohalobacter mucosus]|uniref:Uncharacterized protein n=1 Tax=Rhodohalobacter mucosus TaxID=2079485 RepID=A0A316TTB7_9BACT|nr:hypothetical protein DDZ15_02160 [Rhodohalobacter mucosus]
MESYLHKLRNLYNESGDLFFLSDEFKFIRKKISDFYKLPKSADVILGSSGTDLELLVLAGAMSSPEKSAHNILIEANEVGSGAFNAAQGRYFSEILPLGLKCNIGDSIAGFSQKIISFKNIEVRNPDGSVENDTKIEEKLDHEIKSAFSQGKRPILHIIHRSKTGLIVPSFKVFKSLQEKYKDKIDTVVDACQGRISIHIMNQYLSHGAAILITGSKFYSCPPFAGALIMPEIMSSRIKKWNHFPVGLKDFFTRYEFPESWSFINEYLSTEINVGLLLRWQAAIFEMNKIFEVPNPRIEFVINAFNLIAKEMIHNSRFFNLVEIATQTNAYKVPISTRSPYEINSILTFTVSLPEHNIFTHDDAKIVYQAMYTDLSDIIASESKIAHTPIRIGQPVKVAKNKNNQWLGTFRLALSSNLISEIAMLDDELVYMRIKSDMDFIQKKLELILDNFKIIKSFFRSNLLVNEQA